MKTKVLGWIVIAVLGIAACQLSTAPAAPPSGSAEPPTLPPVTLVPTALIATPAATAAPTATPQPTQGCAAWFFKFRPGQDAGGCADPAVTVDAAGEDFAGGRVYLYGPPPGNAGQPGTIFVIYNNGTWDTFPDLFKPGDPETDPSIIPPDSRFQPAGAIGKVWREHKTVRAVLGWAYGPAQMFTGRYQNPQGDTHNIYIDHGKGLVLRLTAVDNGPRTWKVAGDY